MTRLIQFYRPEEHEGKNPLLFHVDDGNDVRWAARMLVDTNVYEISNWPVVGFLLLRTGACSPFTVRQLRLRYWLEEGRLTRSKDSLRLVDMDPELYEGVETKFKQGGEQMVGEAVLSLGDLSCLGWERIVLPQDRDGWTAWDMPARQTGTGRGWINAMLVSPSGMPYRLGWSVKEDRWAYDTGKLMKRVRAGCPECVLESVAQYLAEEYNPHSTT